MDRIVVVGGSLAGLRACETLRRADFAGGITLIGTEPHLPYDRPPLSKEILTGERGPFFAFLRSPAAIAELDLDLRLGMPATSLDLETKSVLIGADAVPYDGVVLATGGAPRSIPGTPPLAGIHLLRTIDDSVAIRSAFEASPRVVICGAGFIGAEVASSARTHGLEVTVVEALPVPLVRGLGEEMGEVVGRLHGDNGVDLRVDTTITAFEGDGQLERVILSDGDTIDCGLAVVGIGVSPATEWLDSSGLALDDGVVCDEFLAAGPDGVYAAGDIARWYNPLFDEVMRTEHWTQAAEQGAHAARNLLATTSDREPYAPVPFFWSEQYGKMIQFVGRATNFDEVQVVAGDVEARAFVAAYRRDDRLIGALGIDLARELLKFRRHIAASGSWDEALTLLE